MAVTRLGAGAGNRATGTSATLGTSWASFNITASDANTVAIVAVNCSISTNATTTISATYGGVAMTQYSLINFGTTSTTRGAVALFYLFNPGTGSKTVAITTSGATKVQVAGIDVAFSGVDSSLLGAAQTAAATTHSVTSTANGYSLRVLSNGNALTSPNQTSEYLAGAAVTGQGDYISVQSATGTGSAISFTCSGTALTPNSIGIDLGPYVPKAAISTLTDDFNTGSTPDAGKWVSIFGTQSLSSGELLLAGGGALDSVAAYDLTGGAAFFQAKTATTDAQFFLTGALSHIMGWNFNSPTQIEVYDDANTSGLTGVTRTHTNGDWYRIRESGGTIFWDYSANGNSWTNLRSASSSTFVVTSVKIEWGNNGTGTPHFDNFNTAPAATNTGTFFAMF